MSLWPKNLNGHQPPGGLGPSAAQALCLKSQVHLEHVWLLITCIWNILVQTNISAVASFAGLYITSWVVSYCRTCNWYGAKWKSCTKPSKSMWRTNISSKGNLAHQNFEEERLRCDGGTRSCQIFGFLSAIQIWSCTGKCLWPWSWTTIWNLYWINTGGFMLYHNLQLSNSRRPCFRCCICSAWWQIILIGKRIFPAFAPLQWSTTCCNIWYCIAMSWAPESSGASLERTIWGSWKFYVKDVPGVGTRGCGNEDDAPLEICDAFGACERVKRCQDVWVHAFWVMFCLRGSCWEKRHHCFFCVWGFTVERSESEFLSILCFWIPHNHDVFWCKHVFSIANLQCLKG